MVNRYKEFVEETGQGLKFFVGKLERK